MALDTATIIKGTVGILGLSGLGVGGYYGIQSLNKENKETIEKQLEKSNLRKLDAGNSEWQSIFTSYQAVIKKDTSLKFSGNEISNKEELQTKCQEILNKDSSENNTTNNYLKKAKKWCIVPTTVSDGLKERRILKLDDAKDNTEDKEEWDEKIKNYTKTDNSNKIKDLDFKATNIATPSQENRNLIRQKCKALSGKKNYAEDYEEALKNSEDWCTLPK